jgi:hypothetical protein
LPYPLRLNNGFSDVQRLKFSHVIGHKLLYSCLFNATQRRLVKFASIDSYGEEVHRVWANAGYAPQLYSVERLPGGVFMIQMEHLNADEGWTCFFNLSADEKAAMLSLVLDTLKQAHTLQCTRSEGGHFFGVHGDIRQSNVMVRAKGGGGHDIRFIDFDWAGENGVARLPPFARNIDLSPGDYLTQEYDVRSWQHSSR